jgi:hypothetical protein
LPQQARAMVNMAGSSSSMKLMRSSPRLHF